MSLIHRGSSVCCLFSQFVLILVLSKESGFCLLWWVLASENQCQESSPFPWESSGGWRMDETMCFEYQYFQFPSILWCHLLDTFSAMMLLVGWQKGIWSEKTEWWNAGMVIWLGRGADLHMAQLCHCHSCCSKFRLVLTSWFYLFGTGSPWWSQSKSRGAIKRL